MTKAFFDAFPGYIPEDETISDLLRHTTVTRVTMDPERTVLKVYLDADRLISRKELDQVQDTVEEQITAPHGMKTKIIERFHLSGQYTARNLMKVYRASILYELRHYQKCIYTMFRSADIDFSDDDTCVITLEDTLVARMYADDLKHILDKIFTERCGLNFKMTIAYRKRQRPQSEAADAVRGSDAPLRQSGMYEGADHLDPDPAAQASEGGDADPSGRTSVTDAGGAGPAAARRFNLNILTVKIMPHDPFLLPVM